MLVELQRVLPQAAVDASAQLIHRAAAGGQAREGNSDVKSGLVRLQIQPQFGTSLQDEPVAQPVAQRQQFMVQIPAGVAPGAVMTVRAPDGRLLQVQVPAGAVPGSTIQVAA